jgi:hypothetical protein
VLANSYGSQVVPSRRAARITHRLELDPETQHPSSSD